MWFDGMNWSIPWSTMAYSSDSLGCWIRDESVLKDLAPIALSESWESLSTANANSPEAENPPGQEEQECSQENCVENTVETGKWNKNYVETGKWGNGIQVGWGVEWGITLGNTLVP